MKNRGSLPPAAPILPSPAQIDPTNPESLRAFLVSLTTAVQKHLTDRPPATAAAESRLFRSPDGSTWAVSVADDGTFVADPTGSVQGEPLP